ncbi:hypothetical protein [Streptomyces sp. NPDC006739]|uniref:hypothetical protein n=1 Tax=Streptomyces sp. NPDC006739 TaxID=3364763 RepID=UPI003691167A
MKRSAAVAGTLAAAAVFLLTGAGAARGSRADGVTPAGLLVYGVEAAEHPHWPDPALPLPPALRHTADALLSALVR